MNEHDLDGLHPADKIALEIKEFRKTLTPTQLEKYEWQLSKDIKPQVKMFWDSFENGTYDPDNKQPNNRFQIKKAKRLAELARLQFGKTLTS